MLNARKLERITKGAANHWRIQILALLSHMPGLTVFQVTNELEANFKTISEHLRRLALADLVVKKNYGRRVEHRLSPLGEKVLKFLRMLE